MVPVGQFIALIVPIAVLGFVLYLLYWIASSLAGIRESLREISVALCTRPERPDEPPR
jgi:hypothetical protein